MQPHKTPISEHIEDNNAPVLRINKDPKFTPAPTTIESFWTAMRVDPSGRAYALYTFYVATALKQKTVQPWASDQFCANGLGWSYNSIVKYRKLLIKKGLVTHIQKKSYFFIRVNFVTVKLPSALFELSEVNIPDSVIGTTGVYEYHAEWLDRLSGCLDIFCNRLKKRMKLEEKPDLETVNDHIHAVYARIGESCHIGLNGEIPNEKAFWGYIMKGVENELKGGHYKFYDKVNTGNG